MDDGGPTKKKPEVNGKRAVVQSYDASLGRFALLVNGHTKAVDAAANRLEAAIARIARRESETRETRERAQRIRKDILVARRIRGGHVPALMHAWEGLSVN